jgi:PAS domain S-box-containing protein
VVSKVSPLKEKWITLSRSLGFKIGLAVGLILLLSYTGFIYWIVHIQRTVYFQRMIREEGRFSTAVINATRHSMLQDDAEATRSIIRDIGRQEDVSAIRIYNHDGITKFSSHLSEVGTKVDKKAEACFACHSKVKPFAKAVTDKRTRIHINGGHRVLGMITPIYNSESCYQASCHVHSKKQRVLGVLDVGMSLKNLDAHVRAVVLHIVFLGLGTFCAVLITIVLYITFRVHAPVTKLRDATLGIAMGDFSHPPLVVTEDQLGECARSFNIMRDQIRRRTQELTRSREEYKSLFEQVPCFICVINRDFEIVRQNSYMRNLFKGTTGQHCYEAFKKSSHKCPDCHADKTFEDGRTYAKEHCGTTGLGEEADYLSYVAPIVDEKKRVIYAMVLAMDIRDKIRLEKELQISKDYQTNLIENSIHGIVATDANNRVTIYNITAQNILGYTAEEAIGDDDLSKYFPQEFLDLVLTSHLGTNGAAHRLVAQDASVTSSTGEVIPVRFSGLTLFDRGKQVGAVGFFQDLRTFKQLEREKQASDRLAVVGQTVAGLAHGIKNILTGLEGGVFVLETALEDKDDQLLGRGWNMVQKNISRISVLVKDLLSYSRERAPQYEETDPNLLAEEVCALFDVKAQEKAITIERDFDPDAGKTLKIFLDQRGIHACLSNLVANAMDACESDTKKAGHRLIVRTRQDAEGNLLFQVSDNGTGMNDETKRKIFASFYSTKGSRGTGLGLMVTSKIVMEHRGEISFESEEGTGTTFSIVLPSSGSVKSAKTQGASRNKVTESREAKSVGTNETTGSYS